MQATVRSYDPQTASGTVVADDGVRYEFDAAAMAAAGLLHVRPGQRLTVVLDDEGRQAVRLSLGTIRPSRGV